MKKLILAFTLIGSIAASAQESAPVIVDQKNEIPRDSSEHHRLDKKFELSAIILGSGPSITSTGGLSLGYYFETNKMVLIELTGGKAGSDSSSLNSSISNTDIMSTSFGVHFKHYTGNSFYYRAGLDYRKLSYDYKWTASTPIEQIQFNGNSVGISFYIGNQWQWENFTLGCDWVGITVPISSQVKDEYMNAGALADYDYYKNKLDDESKDYIKSTHLNLLRFYLGASF